ncbi:Vacuolar protein sorting-associated protein 35 [Paragonimus heterotremus]|uniref:Vacuolar protein sorting-associated protein 35 n=1 Tax=Paragonimus heterotremus TaxID=100268 RepID=A0A8J4WRE9_9TREM|nr:Vacuolar protein sorting-associated protein 35 [Paragonimus heterotremus]
MHSVDQERLLDEALTSVKQCAFQMERCLDKGNLSEAIDHANNMLREMRTSYLSPKSYYELYIVVTDKLRVFESFLIEEHKSGRRVVNIYESVQRVANIVPRLYLLITVGVFYIKCSEFSRREIMRDLVEMCWGVQHPIRGLFLRSYLLHALRTELLPIAEDPLPSVTDSTAGKGPNSSPSNGLDLDKGTVDCSSTIPPVNIQGTISDSIEFLLRNFTEMNKLWVRLQHQGHSRDRERREQERRELRLLVGTNLNRLSQLDTIDVARYQQQILPFILEQLIECRDVIAQEYLMDVIIQVFPDEFHLATLPLQLNTCSRLQPGVRLRPIICGLVERLSQYAIRGGSSGRSLSIPVCVLDTPDPVSFNGDEQSDENGTSTDQPASSKLRMVNADLFTVFFDGLGSILDSRLTLSERAVEDTNTDSRSSMSVMSNGLPPEDIPAMYSSLVHLAMVLFPETSSALVDACLNSVAKLLERLRIAFISPVTPLSRELLNLLHLPLARPSSYVSSNNTGCMGVSALAHAQFGSLGELRTVLSMPGFRRLVALLDPKTTKCRLACNLLAGALEFEQRQRPVHKLPSGETVPSKSCRLTSEADVDGLFDLISGLIDPDCTPMDDPDEFVEVQNLVAGAIHLLGPERRTDDPGLCYRLLSKAQGFLSHANPAVLRLNFPALIFEGLQLIQAYAELDPKPPDWDESVQQVVTFVHRCITKLVASDAPELALRLFLQAALVLDRIPFSKRESITYEFISQALTLYEEGVSETRGQINAIRLITSTLCQMRGFSEDNRNTLRTQCTRAAAHLLRKHDQSRAVAAAAHQFWPVRIMARENIKPAIMISLSEKADKSPAVIDCSEQISDADLAKLRDGKAVITCLDRAARLADDCMDTTVKAQLLTDILNHTVCLRLAGCTEIDDERVNQLIHTVKQLISEIPLSSAPDELNRHLTNTLNFIQACRSTHDDVTDSDNSVATLFATVNLSPKE